MFKPGRELVGDWRLENFGLSQVTPKHERVLIVPSVSLLLTDFVPKILSLEAGGTFATYLVQMSTKQVSFEFPALKWWQTVSRIAPGVSQRAGPIFDNPPANVTRHWT